MDNFSVGIQHRIFNNEVRKRRIELGLTQLQLGQLVEMGSQTIGHIESFKKYPTRDEGERIAEALGTTPQQLFPQWLELFKPKRTTFTTEHQADERILAYTNSPMMITDGMENFECTLEKEIIGKKIHEVLNTITDREKKILSLRFGLEGDTPMTLEEVGAMFGVTRERIREIEAKALRKLRHPTRLGGKKNKVYIPS